MYVGFACSDWKVDVDYWKSHSKDMFWESFVMPYCFAPAPHVRNVPGLERFMVFTDAYSCRHCISSYCDNKAYFTFVILNQDRQTQCESIRYVC